MNQGIFKFPVKIGKRLAKSSFSASLPEPLNFRGELRARKRLSLHKVNNHPRKPNITGIGRGVEKIDESSS